MNEPQELWNEIARNGFTNISFSAFKGYFDRYVGKEVVVKYEKKRAKPLKRKKKHPAVIRKKSHLDKLIAIYGECLNCGSVENPTKDHVVPRVLAGNNTMANLQLLCYDCNQAKREKIIDYRLKFYELQNKQAW